MRRLLLTSLAALGAWLMRPRLSRLLRTIDRRTGLFAPHGAALYARVAPRILRPLYCLVASDVAEITHGLPVRIPDIGSGPGDLAIELARRLPDASLIGVDLAEGMIDIGRRSARAAGLQARIAFELADAARLPVDDGSIDVVVSSLSLHHWDQPPAVFAEVLRVLRPGGSALVYDLAAITYSRTELAEILGDAGWPPVAAEPVRIGRLPLTLVRRIRLDRPA
jgi:SAM-dependent methyltransferase